jgi:hypothetical protein
MAAILNIWPLLTGGNGARIQCVETKKETATGLIPLISKCGCPLYTLDQVFIIYYSFPFKETTIRVPPGLLVEVKVGMGLKEGQPCFQLDYFQQAYPRLPACGCFGGVLTHWQVLNWILSNPFGPILHLDNNVGVQELIFRTPHN